MKKNTIPQNFLQAGMTLADRRYRVDELIGENGLTVTYKGYDTFRKKVIVIKELFPHQIMQRNPDRDYRVECKKLSDEELFLNMKEHMIQRAKKLIRLYPVEGIANVLTYLEERETVYVIEEYVQGQTLKEFLFKRHSAKFLPEDLMKYLGPVMDTLTRLHANGIFHGTVYPENIRFAGGECVLVGCTNPMEDVASPQLTGIAARRDAYAPVELYVPEAKRGPSADIYEIAAIFYHYVTGEVLPVYYDRINEEAVVNKPEHMLTRVMTFQSEAIMKGVAVYDFERYETMQQMKDALCPEDVDYDKLNSELGVARNFAREPFGYKHQKRAKRNYVLILGGLLLAAALLLGPGLVQVTKGLLIDGFYKKFNSRDMEGRFELLMEMSSWERSLYTNDYTDVDETLTEEERAGQANIKYYDFQLEKYVSHEKFDTDRNYYEYMRIDYRDEVIWINYLSDSKSVRTIISRVPNREDKYEIKTVTMDKKGNEQEDIIYMNYKK